MANDEGRTGRVVDAIDDDEMEELCYELFTIAEDSRRRNEDEEHDCIQAGEEVIEVASRMEIKRVESFDEHQMLTDSKGLVLTLTNGQRFTLTINRVR